MSVNSNSHKAISVGGLFPRKNREAAKKAVDKILEKRITKTKIVDQKTVFETIVKKIKKKKSSEIKKSS